MTEAQAEANGSIAHLHFDAKYRLDDIASVFCLESDSLKSDNAGNDRGGLKDTRAMSSPKTTDLLKMHAYRDAIRRSVGAFVLYPETESVRWSGYHELLPGLGAFVLKPGKGGRTLTQFLTDFLTHYASGSIQQRVSELNATAYGSVRGAAIRLRE